MREAIPYAVGVAVSPIPIAAVLLLLTCQSAPARGFSFLGAALAVWRRRDRRGERGRPWVDSIESFTGARSAGLGVVLSGANPKVVALSLGAALAVADSSSATAGAVAGYTAVGAIGVLVPLALYLAAPVRAQSALRRMRGWLARHEVTVLAALGVLLGALFVRDGLDGL